MGRRGVDIWSSRANQSVDSADEVDRGLDCTMYASECNDIVDSEDLT